MTSRLHAHVVKRMTHIVIVVCAVLGVVMAISFFFVRIFTIRNIIVDAPGMTIELDKNRFGGNLLFFPTEKLSDELLRNYPLLGRVTFEKQLPSTIIVHLIRRFPMAVLKSEGHYYAIGEEGVILEVNADPNGYPLLEFNVGVVTLGSVIKDERVTASIAILESYTSDSPITFMTDAGGAAIQAKIGNTNIFFPQKGDIRQKAATLQIIVEGFRIKGTLPTVIDLRFEKPIITN